MVRVYVGSSGSCICRDGTECMAAHTLGLNVFFAENSLCYYCLVKCIMPWAPEQEHFHAALLTSHIVHHHIIHTKSVAKSSPPEREDQPARTSVLYVRT